MKNLILFFAIFTMIACSSSKEEEEEKGVEMEVDLMQVPPPRSAEEKIISDASFKVSRKLIRNGFIKFESEDAEETRKQIISAVTRNNAYISSDEENRSADKVSYTLVVRIPYIKFDSFLKSATNSVQYFDHKEINVKDVTSEYLDTEARLKTNKEIERRYLHLLGKANSVKDILSIEKEAGVIRAEIESAEGQLKLMADQMQYSTIHITFYKINSTPEVFSQQVKSAFVKGWESFLTVVLAILDVWPFLMLAFGVFFILKRIVSRRKKVFKTDLAG